MCRPEAESYVYLANFGLHHSQVKGAVSQLQEEQESSGSDTITSFLSPSSSCLPTRGHVKQGSLYEWKYDVSEKPLHPKSKGSNPKFTPKSESSV